MDAIVLQAMAKWPNVPECHGWLGLSAQGDWYLRDAQAQACGGFASGQPGARGSRIEHAGLIAFIGRNYACDAGGRWFFQNGPQRVFVELQATPWIWRIEADGAVLSHTGLAASVREVLLDESGLLYLATDLGLGLVHSRDMLLAASAVEQGLWSPQPVLAADLSTRFGFVASPEHARLNTAR